MGIGLRNVPKEVLDELAPVLSLGSQDLRTVNEHGDKVRPSSAWTAKQKAQVAHLPACFLRPPPPRGVVVQLAQMRKHVVMTVSGGAKHIAKRGAAHGKPLDETLHPNSTPTLFCPAHRMMSPSMMREIFFYLTREVADSADPIRRHPRHNDADRGDDSASSASSASDYDPEHTACKSKKVRDWGHRMLGLSALWCDPHTFRALELGFSSVAARRKHKPKDGRRHGIHSVDRLPRLDVPCEACVLAAIGARSQALVDLRAGLLSRMAHDAKEKERRHQDKTSTRRGHHHRTGGHSRASDPDKPTRMPHLWNVVEAYVDAMDAETADWIRHDSEQLAHDLFAVRRCESRRRCHLELAFPQHNKHNKHSDRHRKGHGRPCRGEPARMATKNGHRQPLPLLPDRKDPWATGQTGRTETTGQTGHGQPHRPRRTHRTHRHHRHHPHHGDDGHDGEPSTSADPYLAPHPTAMQASSLYYSPEQAEVMEAAKTASLPAWEGDYRHAIFESGSQASRDYGGPRQSSYGYYGDYGAYGAYGGAYTTPPSHVPNSFVTDTVRTSATPTLRRRTSRLPVRRLSSAIPETSEPVRPCETTPARLSRPASHIPVPRSAASSSTRTASNGMRASPQSTPRTATRAQSTSRSTSPSTAAHHTATTTTTTPSPPSKPRRQRTLWPSGPSLRRRDNKDADHAPPPPPRPRTSARQKQSAPQRPRSSSRPPVNVTSYIALQASVADQFQSRAPSVWPTASRLQHAAAAAGGYTHPPQPESSFYSAQHHDQQYAPWWDEGPRASSVAPDDSISCVLGRQNVHEEQAAQERARQAQRLQELQEELQRQQQQRQRALAQLTGAAASSSFSDGGGGHRSVPSSLPPYLRCMAPEPLQVRRLPPPLPVPPHQQPQSVRLTPWTRLQVQMHCRPLPPLPRASVQSTAITPWPDVRPYL